MAASFSHSGRPVEAALAGLHRVIRDLERVPVMTEKSFLQVGAALQGLSVRLREIGEKSAAAASFMVGGELPSLIDGLGTILGRMESHGADADEKSALAISRFCRMRDGLAEIGGLMASFRDQVSTLRMMKTLTSIQSASLGGSARGFRDVAAAIGGLAQNIQVKSGGVILKTRQLSADLERALAMVKGLAAKQQSLGRVVADTIRHGMDSLAAMHEKCAAAASGVSDRSGEISREIAELVAAMQFHDITRQQMEHVGETLAELYAALRKGAGESGEWDGADDLGAVCELQAAQLTGTAEQLRSAVGRIVANLRKISRDAADASVKVHELFGFADRVGRSSIGEIESGLASVAAVFTENMATDRELARVMVSVTEAMGEIAAFLEDIDDIGAEIRLIALNAIIKAAQAGKEGAALSVIAQTVKRQSEEICRQAAVITDTILGITGCLDELRGGMGEAERGVARGEEVESPGAGLAACLDALKELTGTVMRLLTETDGVAGDLAADVEETIRGMTGQDGAAVLVGDIIPRLRALALSARRGNGPGGRPAGMQAAERRYTMRSERDVHAVFSASTGREEGSFAPGMLPRFGENGFGDNVELF